MLDRKLKTIEDGLFSPWATLTIGVVLTGVGLRYPDRGDFVLIAGGFFTLVTVVRYCQNLKMPFIQIFAWTLSAAAAIVLIFSYTLWAPKHTAIGGSSNGELTPQSSDADHSPTAENIADKILEKLKDPSWKSIDLPQLAAPTPSGGFIQFEGRSVAMKDLETFDRIDSGAIQTGDVLRFRFDSANRGSRPVFDVQSWGAIAIVDPALNPGTRLREVSDKAVREGYDRNKGTRSQFGVGMTVFNFAVSNPLTETEVEGIKSGKLRVHLILFGAWTDEADKRFYWTHAEWTDWPQVPLAHSLWKEL